MKFIFSFYRTILFLLCCTTLSIPFAAAQEGCLATETSLRFKAPGLPGDRSYVSSAGDPITVALDALISPIVVQVRLVLLDDETAGGSINFLKRFIKMNNSLDGSLDGLSVEVAAVPPLRLGGNSIELAQGEATFSSLVVQEMPLSSVPHVLMFSIPGRPEIKPVSTGELTVLSVADADSMKGKLAAIRFANFGFLTRAEASKEIPANTPIPTFFIEAVDSLGYQHSSTSLLRVSVSTDVGKFTSSTTYDGYGRVTIAGLTFAPSTPTENIAQFTFSARFTSDPDTVPAVTLSTGKLAAVTDSLRNRFMDFTQDSFFPYENIGNTAVMDLAMPPVIIRLLTSQLVPDTSNTGLVIQASTEQGVLKGAEALVVQGVATFRDLVFTDFAPRSAVITFTAGTQGNLPVQGSVLYSGAVSVAITPVKAKHLLFSRNSFIQADAPRQVRSSNSRFTIPSIILQVKDSAYQMDSTANDISLELFVEPQGPRTELTEDSVASVVNGVASFTNIVFIGTPPDAFRFVIRDKSNVLGVLQSASVRALVDPLAGLAPAALIIAQEQLFSACKVAAGGSGGGAGSACSFSLKFASAAVSSIFEEEHELFATVGGQIPQVRVILYDAFGEAQGLNRDYVPTLVAFTSDDPNTETLLVTDNGANQGYFLGSTYIFTCLQFKEQPQGLVRIKFRAIDASDGDLPFAAINELRTGFVTVVSTVTPNYGLRFSSENSLITYEGQVTSAVLNVALPDIVVELTDSLHQLDESNSGIVIVASTSSGKLDSSGSREVVAKGRAVFSTLKFIAISDEPILSFTCTVTHHPVSGRQVKTGVLSVSYFPIRVMELVFSPVADDTNEVTHSYQSFSFPTQEEVNIKAKVEIRDSAHQVVLPLSRTAEIEPFSSEADLVDATQKIVNPQCSCVYFTFKLRKYWAGYEGANIFIRLRVAASSSPLLKGKELVIGPISLIGGGGSDSGSASSIGEFSCRHNLQSPLVVAEFSIPVEQFVQFIPTVKSTIGYLMGIEATRVNVSNVRQTHGVRPSDLQEWIGSKVDIVFLEPPIGAVNRKSGSLLAAEMVSLKPGCDGQDLHLEAIYYQENDRGCVPSQFYTAWNASRDCALTSSICGCYANGVISSWGLRCADEVSLQEDFRLLCKTLIGCEQSQITNVCESILMSASSLTWFWVLLGIVGAALIVLAVLYERGILGKRKGANLGKGNS